MTKEIIEGIRKVIVPFVKKRLAEINYEGLGKSDAKEFDEHMNEILDLATKALEQQDVTPRSLNPEADREESKAYCAECDHIEMCSWYPHDGCEWLKTDRYNAGYNAAKREIALSGEYKRAYERGKADAHPDINDGKMSEIPTS